MTQPPTLALLTAACTVLEIEPLDGLQILDAAALVPDRAAWPAADAPADGAWSEIQGVGPFQPLLQPFPLLATQAALLLRIAPPQIETLANSLGERYPAAHPIVLVDARPDEARVVWRGPLGELAEQQPEDGACLYIAPLDPLADLWSADGPQTVMTRLLGPKGCPWDREQTHKSLRKDLLGETHEVLEAIDAGDTEALAEELGDLLLQVLIHAEIARQAGEFSLRDVHHHLASKLIRRHPHVFGEAGAWPLPSEADERTSSSTPQASNISTSQVLQNWDAIKRDERAAKGQKPRGTLDGVPITLPALALAQETLKKASKAGFDADSIAWDWGKLHEEIAELEEAAAGGGANQRHVEAEFGDVLLILSKLARRLNLDAETALREAVGTFRRRFTRLEQIAQERGLELTTINEAQKLALWEAAKRELSDANTTA